MYGQHYILILLADIMCSSQDVYYLMNFPQRLVNDDDINGGNDADSRWCSYLPGNSQ